MDTTVGMHPSTVSCAACNPCLYPHTKQEQLHTPCTHLLLLLLLYLLSYTFSVLGANKGPTDNQWQLEVVCIVSQT